MFNLLFKHKIYGFAASLILILSFISVSLGDGAITLWNIAEQYSWTMAWTIFNDIRLPRTLLALFIGFVLGVSGAVLQAYLRNPLAEPTILGISSTASVGAVIALYFGLANSFSLATPILATLTSMLGLFIMVFIAGKNHSVLILILAGVAVSTLAGAILSLALNFSPSPYAGLEIVFWMMGSVSDRDWSHIYLIMPFIIVGLCLMFALVDQLDALSFGEDVAQSMGINMPRLRYMIIIGTGLSVGACVSVSGAIGFIGLIVPHIVRNTYSSIPSKIILPSGLFGAALLLFADIMVRLIPTDNELKLGVLTAIFGTPFFLYMLFKHRKSLY